MIQRGGGGVDLTVLGKFQRFFIEIAYLSFSFKKFVYSLRLLLSLRKRLRKINSKNRGTSSDKQQADCYACSIQAFEHFSAYHIKCI